MNKQSQIVIVGAGVFGLSTALELSNRGFQNITVLDRHVPPVPDGSSVDISRIIRFDYGDPVYTAIAKEAFDAWANSPEYKGIFFPSPFVLTTSTEPGRVWVRKCIDGLEQLSLPYQSLESSDEARKHFPVLQGPLNEPGYYGYFNRQAGWADAERAIAYLRDQCIERGVSFISGSRGTVVDFVKDAKSGRIQAVKTKSGHSVEGDLFVVATGAWTAGLLPTYNSMLATGQILGFLKLTEAEMQKYQDLPIYINFTSGWFCFPPHAASGYLKVAVHGWGYTNSAADEGNATGSLSSSPPLEPRSQRANFSPKDGVQRLRAGLKEILPELASRDFERTAVCWYTDTPTGDFVVDYHPDHENLLLATGGSGHAFKFLPVLGRYIANALDGSLPANLRQKWRSRTEYQDDKGAFALDGSRGGPIRREFTPEEKAKL